MATAPAITDKGTRAAEMRSEIAALTKELGTAKERLELASKPLRDLETKRDELAQQVADGVGVKLNVIQENNAAIAAAELPMKLLRARVTEKETALNQVRTNLSALEHEIAIDSQREARLRRFDALAMRLRGVTGEVAEMLRILVELKLPELDSAFQDLAREYINVGGILNAGNTPDSMAARAVIREAEMELYDGAYLRCERIRLREGWLPRGDGRFGEFVVRTLFLPR